MNEDFETTAPVLICAATDAEQRPGFQDLRNLHSPLDLISGSLKHLSPANKKDYKRNV